MDYTDLKPGVFIVMDKQPYMVVESEFLRMQQRKPVMKTKLKNLISGTVQEKSFQHSEDIEEAEIEKISAQFLYCNKGEFWFTEKGNPKNRFKLDENILGNVKNYLKLELDVSALEFDGKFFNVEIPVKVEFKVIEAPPAIKGNTAQGGTKVVIIETGAKIATPLFINQGDIIRVNTLTGQYTERVEKGV
ncbi:elongation factor P [Candidatus Wolfebacteria bacterium CG10_big_fil_rev_8_21_14_0_10_31_9]|uniref:Elongation factor P n=1 Tax=Candidatus Wolfebacteria bacterium CG10_big_fil_rev_8_21_14_0_10_31_9 TaxID=1975070 RepID=A0A2H0RBS1_9BACT|nr:MAG: elongation factor P [Candidatus Wolfebacteria bacterium CG10_big_fil_rev_8_21_14_0_10_31_9]